MLALGAKKPDMSSSVCCGGDGTNGDSEFAVYTLKTKGVACRLSLALSRLT